MTIENTLREKLQSEFSPLFLEIENESHNHGGSSTTSHFRVVIVTDAFEGLRLIGRHRKINSLLAHELANEIHALALHTFTPKEWEEKEQKAALSPACAGGSKA
ncbi:BolA family protein [Colwellia sp. RE-S-Sl-9]